MYRWSGGLGDYPAPPAGYWVNPANNTQWLPQSDAAKLGNFCMQGGVVPGRYSVGGNGSNSVLFCRNLTCQEGAMIGAGAALAIALIAPGNAKWLALLPAGWGAFNCLFGGAL